MSNPQNKTFHCSTLKVEETLTIRFSRVIFRTFLIYVARVVFVYILLLHVIV